MAKGKRIRKVRARQNVNGESSAAGDTAERFEGPLPPILPELQWPEEFSCQVGKGAMRRFELTHRAYSAAVYAHEDHFAPRSESLLTGGPTRKLLRSEKEQLLRLFDRECFAVLGSVREFLGPMGPIPPAERIVLLNDYQAWVKQVEELLREAVFAEESEAWNRDLLHLFQSHKPNEPFPQKAFRQLVEKPVFFELEYLTKVSDLFRAQMKLENRLGLMSDIVLDRIRAYEAQMRDKRNKESRQDQMEVPWDEKDSNYWPSSEAAKKVTDGKMSDSSLSKLVTKQTKFHYMRKYAKTGRPWRLRVHLAEFFRFCDEGGLLPDDKVWKEMIEALRHTNEQQAQELERLKGYKQ